MLFEVSPGSDGSGAERYVLYMPFMLAPGASLASMDAPEFSSIAGYRVTLEKLQHRYAISLGSFASWDEAAAHVGKLGASLLWLSLKFNCGVSYPKALGHVTYFEPAPPVPETGLIAGVGRNAIDGNYDADKTVIHPDHKRLTRSEMGQVSVMVGISIENFFASAQQAFSFPTLEHVVEDEKLNLAIEIYAAYRLMLGDNAQFISLVAVLEALLPDSRISSDSSKALLEAKDIVRAARDAFSKDSPEWENLDHLLSRIRDLQRESIGTKLREFATAAISRHPELGAAKQVSLELRDVYKVRSNLLHEGRWDEGEVRKHLSFLRDFVPRLLEVLFRERAGDAPKAALLSGGQH